MAFDPLSAVSNLIGKVIDKAVPDKDLATKLKAAANSEALGADVQLLMGQMKINLQEAMHPSVFVSGWRPFVGWTCGFGVMYHFILAPFLIFLVHVFMETPPEIPKVDVYELLILLGGMLGLSRNRTDEKKAGVQRDVI